MGVSMRHARRQIVPCKCATAQGAGPVEQAKHTALGRSPCRNSSAGAARGPTSVNLSATPSLVWKRCGSPTDAKSAESIVARLEHAHQAAFFEIRNKVDRVRASICTPRMHDVNGCKMRRGLFLLVRVRVGAYDR